jgi:hypothetical protein
LIPSLRRRFNESYTAEKYLRFLTALEGRTGVPPLFRHSETPVFLPVDLIEKMSRYGREMVETLLSDPGYRREARRAVPSQFNVPNESDVPLFVQVDFGLDQDLEPKLVEIQGFPSLYAYQPELARAYADAYEIEEPFLPGDLSVEDYYVWLCEAIVGDRDPENVVLLEIDPDHQKTKGDFVVTERTCGIATIDISTVRKNGRKLYYRYGGREIAIDRIYNRAIVDELIKKQIPLQFDFRDDLDVEWAGHPNWFFKLSKFSLPYLKHKAVPRTRFLDEVGDVDDPEGLVLKPLFSFAGTGVIVGPSREDIAAVPRERRHDYVLQDRVDFRPVIDTPYGMTKIEVRLMYIWLAELRMVNTIIRTGRGAQMGVDHNRGMEWVGASAAFIV